MGTRLTRIAGLMLGLTLLSGGAAATSAHAVSGTVPAYPSIAAPGAGIDGSTPFQLAAPSTLAQAEDPACALEGPDAGETAEGPHDTDNIQDENGADDAAEGDTDADSPVDEAAEDASENANDTDLLQCGDQVENDGAGQ
mgnify:CR=1 FL=1